MSYIRYIVALTSSLAITGGAQAAALIGASDILFGEDLNPAELVTTTPQEARNAFLGNLNGTAGSYGFESVTLPFNLSSGALTARFNQTCISCVGTGTNAINATLTGTGEVMNSADAGRFNTTPSGSKYLRVGTGNQFTLSFSRAIAAFGFYGTDIGDFEGSLEVFLRQAGTSVEDRFDVRTATSVAPSGSLLFWGFASSAASYDRIRFVANLRAGNTTPDNFGFDDFVVADASQVRVRTGPPNGVPEPGSLALAALALLGAAAARRRA